MPEENVIKVRILAQEWGVEISRDPTALGVALIGAGCDGEFETLFPLHRLLTYDWQRDLFEPVEAFKIKEPRLRNLEILLKTGFHFIHKDAVSIFCGRRQHLHIPKRWQSTPKQPQTKISEASVREFLMLNSDGIKTEAELKTLAIQHFGREPTRNLWRPAMSDTPMKRSPGQTDKAILKKHRSR